VQKKLAERDYVEVLTTKS